MPATLCHYRCCRQGVCQGWRGPSIRRPPGDGGPPGSECTPDRPPSPFPIRWFHCIAVPFPLLRSVGRCFLRGCRFVSARSIFLPLPLHTCPGLPSLRAPAPPLSFPRPRLICASSLHHPLLVPPGLGRNVGTLPNAGASSLASLASHGLARRCGSALAAVVDVRTSLSCWCCGVILRRRPLLLQPLFPLDIDRGHLRL